jgi:hypothetical protein
MATHHEPTPAHRDRLAAAKPCPFCASRSLALTVPLINCPQVHCLWCGANGPIDYSRQKPGHEKDQIDFMPCIALWDAR